MPCAELYLIACTVHINNIISLISTCSYKLNMLKFLYYLKSHIHLANCSVSISDGIKILTQLNQRILEACNLSQVKILKPNTLMFSNAARIFQSEFPTEVLSYWCRSLGTHTPTAAERPVTYL